MGRVHIWKVHSQDGSTSAYGVSSGGSDGGDGMEERFARLENDVSKLAADMSDIKVTLGRLDERTSHLPTTFTLMTTMFFLLLAAMAIPQLPNIVSAWRSQPQTQVSAPEQPATP